MQTDTHATINDLAIETIRAPQPGDALEACVVDALQCGTRIAYPPLETPLHRALVESLWDARGWR
jgi:hypothetical protein